MSVCNLALIDQFIIIFFITSYCKLDTALECELVVIIHDVRIAVPISCKC